jgi:ribosomal protein S18 acetylase RimI-like enzyme
MKPALRRMVAADKPALMQIIKQVPEFEPEEVVIAEELIDSFLHDPKSGYYILVAELDSALVGYICYGDTPMTKGTWDMYWAAVATGHQGKGIGKELFEAAEKDIREHKGRLIIIETSGKPQYEKTRHFHVARGYEPVCRIADYYSPGDDLMIFQKRLS